MSTQTYRLSVTAFNSFCVLKFAGLEKMHAVYYVTRSDQSLAEHCGTRIIQGQSTGRSVEITASAQTTLIATDIRFSLGCKTTEDSSQPHNTNCTIWILVKSRSIVNLILSRRFPVASPSQSRKLIRGIIDI